MCPKYLDKQLIQKALSNIKTKINMLAFLDKIETLSKMITNDFSQDTVRKYRNFHNMQKTIQAAHEFLKQYTKIDQTAKFFDVLKSGVVILQLINVYENVKLKINNSTHKVLWSSNWTILNQHLQSTNRPIVDMSGIFKDAVPLPSLYNAALLLLQIAKDHTDFEVNLNLITPSIFTETSVEDLVQPLESPRRSQLSQSHQQEEYDQLPKQFPRVIPKSPNRQSSDGKSPTAQDIILEDDPSLQDSALQKCVRFSDKPVPTLVSRSRSPQQNQDNSSIVQSLQQQLSQQQQLNQQLLQQIQNLSHDQWLNRSNATNEQTVLQLRSLLSEQSKELEYYKNLAQKERFSSQHNFKQIADYYQEQLSIYLRQLEDYTVHLVQVCTDRFDQMGDAYGRVVTRLRRALYDTQVQQAKDFHYLKTAAAKLRELRVINVEAVARRFDERVGGLSQLADGVCAQAAALRSDRVLYEQLQERLNVLQVMRGSRPGSQPVGMDKFLSQAENIESLMNEVERLKQVEKQKNVQISGLNENLKFQMKENESLILQLNNLEKQIRSGDTNIQRDKYQCYQSEIQELKEKIQGLENQLQLKQRDLFKTQKKLQKLDSSYQSQLAEGQQKYVNLLVGDLFQ